jgi:hypothetical protein
MELCKTSLTLWAKQVHPECVDAIQNDDYTKAEQISEKLLLKDHPMPEWDFITLHWVELCVTKLGPSNVTKAFLRLFDPKRKKAIASDMNTALQGDPSIDDTPEYKFLRWNLLDTYGAS